MNTPKISVITVVFNGAMYLEHCIKSVLNQPYSNIEYIVIDGGSTDGTVDIIKKYNQQITYWVSEKDAGIADAFNKGLKIASGDIIGFLNADDWLAENALEIIGKEYGNGEIFHGQMIQHFRERELLISADHRKLNKHMTINHPSVYAKKEVFEMVGFFNCDYKIAMDYEWLLRCVCLQKKFVFIAQVITHMRMEGVSNNQWKKGLKEVRKAKLVHLKKPLQAQVFYYYQLVATGISRFILHSPIAPVMKIYRRIKYGIRHF